MRSAPLAALLALAVFAAPAAAQSGPAPTPGCAGLSAEDAAGDASRYEGSADAPDNFDITGVFFTYRDGKAFAHMRTAAGGATLPPGATGARWYIVFRSGDAQRFVRAAINNLSQPAFEFGRLQDSPTGASYVTEGQTTGTFFPGTPGVLQIAIPPEIGGSPGSELTEPSALTFDVVNTPVQNQLFQIDAAPDEGGGEPYVVGACETVIPSTPIAVPAPTPPPSSGGSSSGTAPTAPPEAPAGAAPLQIKVARTSARMRKRAAAFRLTGAATNLRATLFTTAKRNPKAVGTGRLARAGTLKLKLKGRPKKGRYTLALTGTNPNGRPATLSVPVRLR